MRHHAGAWNGVRQETSLSSITSADLPLSPNFEHKPRAEDVRCELNRTYHSVAADHKNLTNRIAYSIHKITAEPGKMTKSACCSSSTLVRENTSLTKKHVHASSMRKKKNGGKLGTSSSSIRPHHNIIAGSDQIEKMLPTLD